MYIYIYLHIYLQHRYELFLKLPPGGIFTSGIRIVYCEFSFHDKVISSMILPGLQQFIFLEVQQRSYRLYTDTLASNWSFSVQKPKFQVLDHIVLRGCFCWCHFVWMESVKSWKISSNSNQSWGFWSWNPSTFTHSPNVTLRHSHYYGRVQLTWASCKAKSLYNRWVNYFNVPGTKRTRKCFVSMFWWLKGWLKQEEVSRS